MSNPGHIYLRINSSFLFSWHLRETLQVSLPSEPVTSCVTWHELRRSGGGPCTDINHKYKLEANKLGVDVTDNTSYCASFKLKEGKTVCCADYSTFTTRRWRWESYSWTTVSYFLSNQSDLINKGIRPFLGRVSRAAGIVITTVSDGVQGLMALASLGQLTLSWCTSELAHGVWLWL